MGQQLSGLPVRHPVAPLLVLVRAEPGLEPHLSAAGGARAATLATAPSASACATTSGSAARSPARSGTTRPSRWRIETSDGEVTAEVLIAAPRIAERAVDPGPPGPDDLRGRGLPHRALEPRPGPRGERVAVIGTGASAIQTVPRSSRRRAPERLPAHAALGDAAPRPADHRLRAPLYRRFPALQRAVRAGVYWSRELVVPGLAFEPRMMKALQRIALPPHGKAGQRPRAAGEADPELRAGLQADPALQRRGIRRSSSPTSSWSPTASARSGRTGS